MATVKDSVPHVVRTANDKRQKGMYEASIGRIEQINSKIRLLRLYLAPNTLPLRHLPGQYIDLHIPNVDVVGGFTITSPPQTALGQLRLQNAMVDDPFIELAIQKSPSNPPASYLWRPPQDIINAPVQFRVGGNFTYPPLALTRTDFESIDNIVFIAGGVGINPIMSILSALDLQEPGRLGGMTKRVRILYSSRRESQGGGEADEILFEKRLAIIAKRWSRENDQRVDFAYTLFQTSGPRLKQEEENVIYKYRRMGDEDLHAALGPEDKRAGTLAYVCGLPTMTDAYADHLTKAPGMDVKRVLYEKWW